MSPPEITIAGRKIGLNHPPLVIAEVGINHNGSLAEAKHLADEAKKAGVEFLKHQTHIVDDEMSDHAKEIFPPHVPGQSIFDIIDSCSLSEEEEKEFKNYVENLGMIFISTPFSRAAADRLESMGVGAYKIGSGEVNHYPLIEHIASFGKPMLVSTGMNTIDSVRPTVEIMRKAEVPFGLFHCTNKYPMDPEDVRLGAMQELAEAFPDAVIGLSDHTCSNLACLAAVANGASVLERHFTDTMDREGPDIICSMDTQTCADLIRDSKEVAMFRGGRKESVPGEEGVKDFAFASIVCNKKEGIKAGEKLTRDNLWGRRPGSGELLVKDAWYKVVDGNYLAKRDIAYNEHLTWDAISEA